ncbi:hypothetical protein AMS68_004527 [Peltaster fructicola]|uniref:AB hydrolase-1 domain-containing protein n=1 Tax=Peltaster fructicola TaxID=286661 RepID=A0A6H0XX57_9PEZI|nr:hypothetical protein AMS68_004527 [Peltaster fructicola]
MIQRTTRPEHEVLARDLSRTVYAIDLRNHGDSSHSPQHDYSSMASDVECFVQEMKLEKPTLIGHSMGAKAAMAVALRKRVKVANLIPVDNAPVDAALKTNFHDYVKGMKEIEGAQVQKQSEADAILQKYENALPIRQFLLTNLMRNEDGKYVWRVPLKWLSSSLGKMGDFPFTNPDEVRYEGPTLMVRGTKSPYVADEMLPIVGRFFPKFELRDIDAAHWVISEKPEEFRTAVVEWLQDKE